MPKDEDKVEVLRNVMCKSTDFLRMIVTSHTCKLRDLVSLVCPHCGLFPVEEFHLVGVEKTSIEEEVAVRLVVPGLW